MDKKQQKLLILSLLTITSFLLIMNLVSAEGGYVNITSPISGTNYTSFLLNCTYKNATGTEAGNMTSPKPSNVTWWQEIGGVWTEVTVTGEVCNNATCYGTAAASALTDGLLQNFSCRLGNDTVPFVWSKLNATNIDIYTSTPSCGFTGNYPTLTYLSAGGISPADTSTYDALTTITYNWTLWDSNFHATNAYTTTSPTFKGTDFNKLGNFQLGLSVLDRWSNRNDCTNYSIFVKGNDGDADSQVVYQTVTSNQQQATGISTNLIVIIIIIVIILVSGVAFFIVTQAKKR